MVSLFLLFKITSSLISYIPAAVPSPSSPFILTIMHVTRIRSFSASLQRGASLHIKQNFVTPPPQPEVGWGGSYKTSYQIWVRKHSWWERVPGTGESIRHKPTPTVRSPTGLLKSALWSSLLTLWHSIITRLENTSEPHAEQISCLSIMNLI